MFNNKAAIMKSVKNMEFQDVPMPEVKNDQVLVKIEYVGICGSDVHYYEYGRIGDFVVDKPIILGHECAGVITGTGKDVKNLKVGIKLPWSRVLPVAAVSIAKPEGITFVPMSFSWPPLPITAHLQIM